MYPKPTHPFHFCILRQTINNDSPLETIQAIDGDGEHNAGGDSEKNAGGDLEMNVGGEEEDKASGVLEENAGGKGNDEPVEELDAEEEALDRSLGIPYKKKCDQHSHKKGKYRCIIPHSPSGKKCNSSYCELCIARNVAFSMNQMPYHFANDMCMVCHYYYKNHLFSPRDILFTASIRTHKPDDPYPMIQYHDHQSRLPAVILIQKMFPRHPTNHLNIPVQNLSQPEGLHQKQIKNSLL